MKRSRDFLRIGPWSLVKNTEITPETGVEIGQKMSDLATRFVSTNQSEWWNRKFCKWRNMTFYFFTPEIARDLQTRYRRERSRQAFHILFFLRYRSLRVIFQYLINPPSGRPVGNVPVDLWYMPHTVIKSINLKFIFEDAGHGQIGYHFNNTRGIVFEINWNDTCLRSFYQVGSISFDITLLSA